MMAELGVALATGFGLALASSAHCMVMCSPLAMAARSRGSAAGGLQYALARLCTYTLLGSLAGSVGHLLYALPWARFGEALMSWLLGASLLFVAWRLSGLRGASSTQLLRVGKAPKRNRIGRLLSRVADEPLLLGAATALLPCGALFAAVMAAAALGSPTQGALAMATFAAVTGLALTFTAQLARLVQVGATGRKLLAGLMVAGAVIMFVRPLATLTSAAPPHCHGPASQLSHEER